MTPRFLSWPLLLVTMASAVAQKPPPRSGQPDDAAALDAAINAVDRAKQKQNPDKPATPASGTDARNPAKPTPPAKPGAVVPAPPKPAAGTPSVPSAAKPKTAAVTQTQITSLEDAELDNARNIIVFRKNVVVDRPDLKIWCDQLEIALNKGGTKSTAAAGAAKPEAEPDALGAESIKSATATAGDGGLVVIWRKTETGDVVAVGRRAVYTATDGAFTITGLPEVLRDMSLHFHSPGEADKLVLFKNGSARGSKKQDLNLSIVRAKEIRQRMFSHVPGRRPAEASAAGEAAAAPASDAKIAPPSLPAPPPKSTAPN
jgi:lipopolysaccharide export system protein LptA